MVLIGGEGFLGAKIEKMSCMIEKLSIKVTRMELVGSIPNKHP